MMSDEKEQNALGSILRIFGALNDTGEDKQNLNFEDVKFMFPDLIEELDAKKDDE